ncbi:phosphopantetheine-binding protein [Actinacidiphila glaucinigra]|uniref:phosphopantetheine-binding protein n=1 Tax=Actinacidiphila glaucinigra TaxID=235986 RepID=UPI003D8B10F4
MPISERAETRDLSEAREGDNTRDLLRDIWAQALERDEVDVDADFFEMGGHSLLALRITGEVSEVLDIDVPMPTLMRNPTLRLFTEAVTALAEA